MAWIFLIGLILGEIAADIFAKEYAINNRLVLGATSLMFYVLANVSWLVSMRYGTKLAIGANIFAVSTGIIATVIGVMMYGEVLEPRQYIGIVLGSLAILFLV